MTMQSDPLASDPQGIGNAFVKQYYTVLHNDPSHAYKFYLDLSVLSRPGTDGAMKSVTTLKEINELILSLDYQSYKAEISFADAQFSLANGVIVLVTGSLIGKDDVRRKFTQYVDDKEPVDVAYNDIDEGSQADLSQDTEVTPVLKNAVANHSTFPSDNDDNNVKEVSPPLDNGKHTVPESGVVSEQLPPPTEKSQKDSHPVNQTSAPVIQDDAPKKSYLSVVHALTKNSAPFIVRAPAPKPKPVEQSRKAAIPEESAPKSYNTSEKSNESSGKNTSIFVANLPMSATEEMLEEVFQKFGPIKPNGIQVRSFKDNKNCFGFVEFESATSVQSAVTDPAVVGNQGLVVIETKMATEMTTSEAVGTSVAAVTLEEMKGMSSQVKLGAMRGETEKLIGKFIKMGDKELLLLAMKVKVKGFED
ncbi:Ras GTPase-activating-binding protein 2 [Gossypium arboreum]|uniref:Ras GTPase-activating-binding protein 2 n=1 Tax=Gossypium arboreum TaxID=29729 RepID=A0A0B0MP41_GOSAR|nr:Ras GTPase-activating-binding protein 2 [Gossypium arboreum]